MRVVANAAGVIVETHDYESYGQEIGSPACPSASLIHYAGQERDYPGAAAGDYTHTVDSMHFRSYGALIGRFYKPDNVMGNPMNPQSWNLYSYVQGNPVGASDPTGHFGQGGMGGPTGYGPANGYPILYTQGIYDVDFFGGIGQLPVSSSDAQSAGTYAIVRTSFDDCGDPTCSVVIASGVLPGGAPTLLVGDVVDLILDYLTSAARTTPGEIGGNISSAMTTLLEGGEAAVPLAMGSLSWYMGETVKALYANVCGSGADPDFMAAMDAGATAWDDIRAAVAVGTPFSMSDIDRAGIAASANAIWDAAASQKLTYAQYFERNIGWYNHWNVSFMNWWTASHQ